MKSIDPRPSSVEPSEPIPSPAEPPIQPTQARVRIAPTGGLHLRPAAQLVALSRKFRSLVRLRANGRSADWRSILDLLLLEAHGGTVVEIEASGDDERTALAAVLRVLRPSGSLHASPWPQPIS